MLHLHSSFIPSCSPWLQGIGTKLLDCWAARLLDSLAVCLSACQCLSGALFGVQPDFRGTLVCVCVYECALGLQALWQVISMRCFIAPLNVSLNLNQFLCKVEKLLKYGYIIGLTRCEFAEFILKLVDFQFQIN